MRKIVMGAVLLLLSAMAAAERGDANKSAVIGSDSIDIDQVSLTRVLTGNVTVDKGTLHLASDKAVLKETPEGDMTLVLTSAGGKPATFRQKRDGGVDLWVDGQAQRIEYDEKSQMVKLFGNAKVKQLEGSKVTDELDSEFISYDSRMEQLVSRNDISGQNKVGKGRSTLIIAPHRSSAPAPAPVPAPAPAAGKQ
jgi:lipopolysaccharide export system protein LptA